MTREEAIKRLNVWLKCANCPEDKQCYDKYLHTICEDYDYREEVSIEEAVNMAIKALEQEPILDKIRTEIEQNAYPIVHGVNNHEKGMTLYGILQVIDKYKAEVEPQVSEEYLPKYEAKVITRGNCMMCGKELTEGLFFCKECGDKANKSADMKED